MNATDATLIATWCPATATAPSEPISNAAATNRPASMSTAMPIGTPSRRSEKIVRQCGASNRANGAYARCRATRADTEMVPHSASRLAVPQCATRRQAEAAHQHVADRQEQDQAEQAEVHRWPRYRQAFGETAQREVTGQGRRSPGDRVQELARLRGDRRLDADRIEQHAGGANHEEQRDAERERQPQRLAEQRPDACVLAGAGQLRDRRRQRSITPIAATIASDHRLVPTATRPACAHPVPGQQRVDDIHADRRQLSEDQRCRQQECFANLAAPARRVLA